MGMKEGAKRAVEDCLKIKTDEKVVIITDRETQKIGSEILEAAQKITQNISYYVMEDFGQRPFDLPDMIASTLKEADVSIYAAQGCEGECQKFRGQMLEIVEKSSRLRHAHMVGINEQVMREGMCSDYRKIQRLSEKIYRKVSLAKEIRVVADGGTDLIARFSPEIKWVDSDGIITAGHWDNLPGGEVFTCPVDVNGILVVDGCLGDYFDDKYGLLDQTPVGVFIENGRAIKESIRCANEQLAQELTEYLFAEKYGDRVGEFALGTNIGLKKLIGNLLQDEKMPGFHLAFGGTYPEETGAKWDSDSHIDCVVKKPVIYSDGKIIMRGGKYVL